MEETVNNAVKRLAQYGMGVHFYDDEFFLLFHNRAHYSIYCEGGSPLGRRSVLSYRSCILKISKPIRFAPIPALCQVNNLNTVTKHFYCEMMFSELGLI